MSYGLIYRVPFSSLDKDICVVEIEKEGYGGEPMELTAGGTPFTVDIEDEEFLYTPIRFSSAKLDIVGSDYLRSLFSTAYKEYRVTFKRNESVTWCGYIKPELYTQDYSSNLFTLELECMSAMSVLEFIDYTMKGDNKAFVSLWYLLKRCIEAAGGKYTAVYVPHVYASGSEGYASGENIIEKMLISEQNFFDEDDKPMKLKEVLEEICKFLNWTCVDWMGELYFVDVDHEGKYYKYDLSLATREEVSVNSAVVQDIGFAGSDHSLDILPGYNKVTVKCSNYPVDKLLPEEDFSALKEFSYSKQEKEIDGKHSIYSITEKRFYYPGVYTLYQYIDTPSTKPMSEEELEARKDEPNNILGAMNIKRIIYKTVDGEPDIHNYNWEELIQVRRGFKRANGSHDFLADRVPVIEFEEVLPAASYSDGAIVIEASVQITENNDLTVDEIIRNGKVRASCMLSIGDWSYTGSEWVYADTNKWFDIYFPMKDVLAGGFGTIENTKKLSQPYDNLTGYIIELPKGQPLIGSVSFKMCALRPQDGNYTSLFAGVGYYLKDLRFSYAARNDIGAITDKSDRLYENVLNENYINELDEIELKISSYNNDGACYSKVLISEGYNNWYLTDNLYNVLLDKRMRPEELLITRIINHYSTTRIKLTQVIKNSKKISPITILGDNFLVDKKFINSGGTIDYSMNRFECIMVER